MNQEQLSYEQFEEAVLDFFRESSRTDARINIRTVLKNNGVKLRGLTIFNVGDKMTPTVYLEEFYDVYLQGTPLHSVLHHMKASYDQRKRSENIEVNYFYQYESVKDTLRIKLINYEKNMEFLKDVPHIRILDLAVVGYSLMESGPLEGGAITICRSHLELWKVTKETLFMDAIFNSRKYTPKVMIKIVELLEEMQEGLPKEMQLELPLETEHEGMCILTNCDKFNGASVIMYPEVLEHCARHFRTDFYIIPSSIHEVIVMSVCESEPMELLSMVRDVNDGQVAEEEILSYHVYTYHGDDGVLEDLVTKEVVRVKDIISNL